MPKRKRRIIDEKEDRYEYIKHGQEYEPFIKIQDFPSQGRSSRRMGIKTGRQHEFLSDLERNIFLMLEFADRVIDIREQFPLELEKTLLISEELGIKHPSNPKTGEDVHLTSDFLITVRENDTVKELVRTAKYKKDLVNKRTIEKLYIEEQYWKSLGFDWGIITEQEINKNFCLNIDDVLRYYDLKFIEGFSEMSRSDIDEIVLAFLQRIIDTKRSMRLEALRFERDLHLQAGLGVALFKHLIARKYIIVDLERPLSMENNIKIELLGKAREMGEVVS